MRLRPPVAATVWGFYALLQSFEIPHIPVQRYTFKRRPAQTTSTPTLELPEEAGEESPAPDGDPNGAEVGDTENGDEDGEEDIQEEALPPPPALKALHAPGTGDHFLLAMGGWARGAIFECSWQVRKLLFSCKTGLN